MVIEWEKLGTLNWEAVSAVGAWVGPVVTIIGFILVARQLRGERIALETQTGWQIYELSLSVLNMFVEHPELRPYFYDNKPVPDLESEKNQVLAAAEVVADHLENIVLSRKSLGEETYAVWVKYMAGIYRKSPVLQGFLHPDSEGYRYSEEFLVRVREGLPPDQPQA